MHIMIEKVCGGVKVTYFQQATRQCEGFTEQGTNIFLLKLSKLRFRELK